MSSTLLADRTAADRAPRRINLSTVSQTPSHPIPAPDRRHPVAGQATLCVFTPHVLRRPAQACPRVGDEVIGAVGVGGAPSGQIDEECATAGIERARDQLR